MAILPDVDVAAKHQKLREIIAGYDSALVCFSGGVDSMLLLRVAHDVLGDRCVALTAVSITMARSERQAAIELAAGSASATRWSSRTSSSGPGSPRTPPTAATTASPSCWRSPGPPPSAWACARSCWAPTSTTWAITAPAWTPPSERGARQPMVEAQLDKAEVRALSRQLGLPTWDKPQLACLSSRFPYGTEITPEKLQQVDAFEDGLRALGFRQLRVRYHGEVARLELEAGADEPGARPRRPAAHRRAGAPRWASPSSPSTWPASPRAR